MDDCMGPRYLDPETDDELGLAAESRPTLTYFANSSVMEYASERFGETVGLGSYDAHAMKSLYGRVLETFDAEAPTGMPTDQQEAFASRMGSQLSDLDYVYRSDGPFDGQTFAKPMHYTELARRMKLFDTSRCRDATEQEKATAQWRIVHGKVCASAPRDHAAWMDFENGPSQPNAADDSAFVRTSATAATGASQVRWFYRYGTGFNAHMHTNHSDAGADAYEVTRNTIEKFDANYPWRYFRRKNREFFTPSLPSAASSGTFERLRAYHWNAASRNAFYRTLGKAPFDEIAESDDWHRPMLMAETEMFKALARTILAPEPGQYGSMNAQPSIATA